MFHAKISLVNGGVFYKKYKLSDLRRIMKDSPLYRIRQPIPVEPWIIENCLNFTAGIKRIDIKKGVSNEANF
jgi:hypothetical protein